MAKKRILVIIIAVFLAAVVFFVLKKALTPKEIIKPEQAQKVQIRKIETSWILVTADDLKQGEIIEPDDLEWAEWPDRILPAKVIIAKNKQDINNVKEANEIVGKQAKSAFAEGIPIHAGMVTKKEYSASLAEKIQKDRKAISIPISEVSAVSGFILPGDYVDLIIVSEKKLQISPEQIRLQQNQYQEDDSENEFLFQQNQQTNYGYAGKKQIVMKNILVLAVGDQTKGTARQLDNKRDKNEGETANLKAKTATLEVSDEQASNILKAQFEGASISLILAARDQTNNRINKSPLPVSYEDKKSEIRVIRKGKATIEEFIRK